jgi:PAS domain S-box-containing protein
VERGVHASRNETGADEAPRRSRLLLFQKAVRESEARHALVVEALAEGIYEWDTATDRLYVSSRLIEILQLEQPPAVARDWNERIHPEDLDAFRGGLIRHLKGETPRLECTYRFRGVSGYRWICDRGIAVRDDTGHAIKVVGAISDITAQKHAQAALRASEERYAIAMEAMNEGVIDWNLDTEEIYCSPCIETLFGLPPGVSFTPQLLLASILPDDRPAYREKILAHLRGERSELDSELRCTDAVGRLRWIRLRGRALRDEAGRARRMVTSVRDITDLKRREAELRCAKEQALQASEAKSGFLANMSHELRTPLNAVIGITELLMEDLADLAAERTEPLARIYRAGKQLLSLIDDILDLSKIEAGKMTLNLSRFDLEVLVADLLPTAEPLAMKNGNRLQLHFPEERCLLHTDEGRLRQVILNLLANACKFCSGGTVTVRVTLARRDGREGVAIAVTPASA